MAKKIAASEANGAAVIDKVAKEVVKSSRGRELHSAGAETFEDSTTNGFEGQEADDPVVAKPGKKKAAELAEKPEGELSELEKLAREATGEPVVDAGEAENDEADPEADPDAEVDPDAAKPVVEPDASEVLEAKKVLKEWKWLEEKTGQLDLPKLVSHVQKTLGPAYTFAVNVDKLIGKHEALRAAYWTALEAEGQLTDESAKAALAEYRKKQADAPAKRTMTKEQFTTEYNRLWNMGKEAEALDLRDEFILAPKLAAIENATKAAEEKRAQERQTQEEAATRASHSAEANKQTVALAKQIPSIIGVENGKAYWKNKEVQTIVSELLENVNPLKMNIEDMIYVALRKMKMTKAKPATAKIPSRPSRTVAASKNGAQRNRTKEAHLGELEVYAQEADA